MQELFLGIDPMASCEQPTAEQVSLDHDDEEREKDESRLDLGMTHLASKF